MICIKKKKTTSITFNPLKFSLALLQTQANKDIRSCDRERERDIQRSVFTVFTCPRGPVSGPVITRGRVGVIGSVRRPRPHMPPACLPAKTDEPRAIHIFPGFTAILPRLRGYRRSPSGRPLLYLYPLPWSRIDAINGRGGDGLYRFRGGSIVCFACLNVVHMEFLWRDEAFKRDVESGRGNDRVCMENLLLICQI